MSVDEPGVERELSSGAGLCRARPRSAQPEEGWDGVWGGQAGGAGQAGQQPGRVKAGERERGRQERTRSRPGGGVWHASSLVERFQRG